MKNLILAVSLNLFFWGCSPNEEYKVEISKPSTFLESIETLTDIIVHDIFSPPVASRVYVYPCVAAYETIIQNDASYKSLAGQLTGLKSVPTNTDTVNVNLNIASVEAFFIVCQNLIFSEDKMEEYRQQIDRKMDSLSVPKKVIKASKSYGKTVAEHILQWANNDNYKETRSMSKFGITDENGRWKPTPPAYMEGIEPHWRKIRPMVVESADQFRPEPPTPFSTDKKSQFYLETMEVYDAVKNAKEEEKLIASFWDCNPYVMNQTGHMMFATKKITPGGHWMGIAGIVSKEANLDIVSTIETHTMVAIALFDGFISCWDEKYNSNLIRPETVINDIIDPDWVPLLQTPPFPEHTSGHSVISTAAATVLTNMHGDNFKYTDDVEVKYGLPSRDFESFNKASAEAAISRLYGGIHYMPAITEGVKQGKSVGNYINSKTATRK